MQYGKINWIGLIREPYSIIKGLYQSNLCGSWTLGPFHKIGQVTTCFMLLCIISAILWSLSDIFQSVFWVPAILVTPLWYRFIEVWMYSQTIRLVGFSISTTNGLPGATIDNVTVTITNICPDPYRSSYVLSSDSQVRSLLTTKQTNDVYLRLHDLVGQHYFQFLRIPAFNGTIEITKEHLRKIIDGGKVVSFECVPTVDKMGFNRVEKTSTHFFDSTKYEVYGQINGSAQRLAIVKIDKTGANTDSCEITTDITPYILKD